MSRGRQNFKLAAIVVLQKSSVLLTPKEIVNRAIEENLIKPKGNTPGASMRGMLSKETIKHGKQSNFKRIQKGKYTINNYEQK